MRFLFSFFIIRFVFYDYLETTHKVPNSGSTKLKIYVFSLLLYRLANTSLNGKVQVYCHGSHLTIGPVRLICCFTISPQLNITLKTNITFLHFRKNFIRTACYYYISVILLHNINELTGQLLGVTASISSLNVYILVVEKNYFFLIICNQQRPKYYFCKY